MTAVAAIIADLQTLGDEALTAAREGDWFAVERYEAVRLGLLGALGRLAEDTRLRLEVLDALRIAQGRGIEIGAAMDRARRQQQECAEQTARSGRASRVYANVRSV